MRLAMTLSLPQHPSSVTRAREVLTSLLQLTDADEEGRRALAILITEASANAVIHGDAGSGLTITITIEDDLCVLEVGNHGTLDGATLTTEPPGPTQTRGRGLLLIAALSDTAAFVAAPPGQIRLRMTRYLTAPDPASAA
jgi:serine/threonine-protein kinase RsbW